MNAYEFGQSVGLVTVALEKQAMPGASLIAGAARRFFGGGAIGGVSSKPPTAQAPRYMQNAPPMDMSVARGMKPGTRASYGNVEQFAKDNPFLDMGQAMDGQRPRQSVAPGFMRRDIMK